MQTDLSVHVAWKDKLRFVGLVEGLPQELAIDYYPPLGERAGFTGLETLLLALAGCSGQTVAFLLGKMNQDVERLEVKATGTRRNEHPMMLTSISLNFTIGGPSVAADAVAKAIRLAEEQYCPVWAMLKPSTKVRSTFALV